MEPASNKNTFKIEEDPITFKPITKPIFTPCCLKPFQDDDVEGLDGWLRRHCICPLCNAAAFTKERLLSADKIGGISQEWLSAIAALQTASTHVETPCGHIFERKFIEEYLENQHSCPLDDTLLWKEDLMACPDPTQETQPIEQAPVAPTDSANKPSKLSLFWKLFCRCRR